jgi:septal ring factor EnvC (AmiA/AmiB activator)
LESDKNKFLADGAFVLRKHEVFLKVKEEVTKAKHSYNRILGYAKDSEDGNSDYWKNQLPFYQKTIDLAKIEVQKTMENLAEKGVNVAEIEKQTKATEVRILELDQKLEELPTTKENLIIQFKEEKRQQLKQSEHKDYVKERFEENILLFNFPHFENKNIEVNKEKVKSQYYLPETNMEQSRMSSRR